MGCLLREGKLMLLKISVGVSRTYRVKNEVQRTPGTEMELDQRVEIVWTRADKG